MGLDIVTPTHDRVASWAYSGFMSFREKLARSIGIPDLKEAWRTESLPKEHGLYDLLIHSDCEGELTPEQCAKIAPALAVVVAPWPDSWDKVQAQKLVRGLIHAAAEGYSLIFR